MSQQVSELDVAASDAAGAENTGAPDPGRRTPGASPYPAKIHEGKSGNQTAQELGCAYSTTLRIVSRFRAEGLDCLLGSTRQERRTW